MFVHIERRWNEWHHYFMPHENIIKVLQNPYFHIIKVIMVALSNSHLQSALIINNIFKLHKIITNAWALHLPPLYLIMHVFAINLFNNKPLTQLHLHPFFKKFQHSKLMSWLLTYRRLSSNHGKVNQPSLINMVVGNVNYIWVGACNTHYGGSFKIHHNQEYYAEKEIYFLILKECICNGANT